MIVSACIKCAIAFILIHHRSLLLLSFIIKLRLINSLTRILVLIQKRNIGVHFVLSSAPGYCVSLLFATYKKKKESSSPSPNIYLNKIVVLLIARRRPFLCVFVMSTKQTCLAKRHRAAAVVVVVACNRQNNHSSE